MFNALVRLTKGDDFVPTQNGLLPAFGVGSIGDFIDMDEHPST